MASPHAAAPPIPTHDLFDWLWENDQVNAPPHQGKTASVPRAKDAHLGPRQMTGRAAPIATQPGCLPVLTVFGPGAGAAPSSAAA